MIMQAQISRQSILGERNIRKMLREAHRDAALGPQIRLLEIQLLGGK
jgi:hypothetical protein